MNVGCKASLQRATRDGESWNAEPFFVCRTAVVEGFWGKEGGHLVREGASAEGFRVCRGMTAMALPPIWLAPAGTSASLLISSHRLHCAEIVRDVMLV